MMMEMLLSSALSHGTAGIYDGMALVSTTTGSHGGVCCCSLAKIIRNSVIARAGILFETQMTKEKNIKRAFGTGSPTTVP